MTNRIVIELDKNGELSGVTTDTDCRIFVLDNNCQSEPVYELSEGRGKITGPHHVHEKLGNNLAATYDSSGPWKRTSPVLTILDAKVDLPDGDTSDFLTRGQTEAKAALDAVETLFYYAKETLTEKTARRIADRVKFALTAQQPVNEEIFRGLSIIEKHLYTQTEKAQDGIAIIKQSLARAEQKGGV